MEVFYKKDSLIRTICFMAFFVAINVVCSFVAVYAPLVSIILIIILPLTSAVVEINCKDRWFPIYAIATIGLSIVVTLSQIDFTIFYIVPSIFTGYIFGFFSKKNYPDIFAIFFASVIQAGLSYLFIPLIYLLTGVNLFDILVKMFRISNIFWFETCLILVFFLIGLTQTILSFIVVDNELKKMGIKKNGKKDYLLFSSVSTLVSIFISVILAIISMQFSFLFLGFSFFFAVFTCYYHYQKQNKILLILDIIFCFCGVVFYALLNSFFESAESFLLFEIVPFLISGTSILKYFLKKFKQ